MVCVVASAAAAAACRSRAKAVASLAPSSFPPSFPPCPALLVGICNWQMLELSWDLRPHPTCFSSFSPCPPAPDHSFSQVFLPALQLQVFSFRLLLLRSFVEPRNVIAHVAPKIFIAPKLSVSHSVSRAATAAGRSLMSAGRRALCPLAARANQGIDYSPNEYLV